MYLGICGGTSEDNIKLYKETGYRYLEIGLGGFGGEGIKHFEGFLKNLDAYKFRCETANVVPFPGEYNPEGRLTGEQLGRAYDKLYALLKSTSRLNLERLILGGGGVRTLPSPEVYDNVLDQAAEILRTVISPICAEFGITAVIEPLCSAETPFIKTVADGVRLAKIADRANIRVMSDLYHVHSEKENLDEYKNFVGWIRHAHIAKPVPRIMPTPVDGFDYKPFFNALASADYSGRISVEAGQSDPDYKKSVRDAYEALSPFC
ncbi:hypothetical protein FACS1894219_12400 [Clostridia bacterium]|nr:hypothetical protein FACS1894219_12400 [Clostridia bacterium]